MSRLPEEAQRTSRTEGSQARPRPDKAKTELPRWSEVEVKVVDRVYKAGIPELKKALTRLKEEFSRLDMETEWTKLRVEPLLKHAEALERLLNSPDFSYGVLAP